MVDISMLKLDNLWEFYSLYPSWGLNTHDQAENTPPQILINQHVILSASWPCGENMTAAFREGHGGLVAVITLPLWSLSAFPSRTLQSPKFACIYALFQSSSLSISLSLSLSLTVTVTREMEFLSHITPNNLSCFLHLRC